MQHVNSVGVTGRIHQPVGKAIVLNGNFEYVSVAATTQRPDSGMFIAYPGEY